MSRRYRIASATALEVACPPWSDRPRCPSASGRRDLYPRACPRGSRPPQESGITTAPNWAIAPAGPSPARTDSGTGCTWSLTSWAAALSAAPYRTRFLRHDSPHWPKDERYRAAGPDARREVPRTGPLPVLRARDELPAALGVLSRGSADLAPVAQSAYARKVAPLARRSLALRALHCSTTGSCRWP